jgi:hypothetical protein
MIMARVKKTQPIKFRTTNKINTWNAYEVTD